MISPHNARILDWDWGEATGQQIEGINVIPKLPRPWELPQTILNNSSKAKGRKVHSVEDLLDQNTNQITALAQKEILSHIEKGSLSTVQIVMAFGKRIAFTYQLVSLRLILTLTCNRV